VVCGDISTGMENEALVLDEGFSLEKNCFWVRYRHVVP
jgi:hypothetical protein